MFCAKERDGDSNKEAGKSYDHVLAMGSPGFCVSCGKG
jgi:hypothetical protein